MKILKKINPIKYVSPVGVFKSRGIRFTTIQWGKSQTATNLFNGVKLNSGFTFIELLVSVFIIVMITSLLLVNYKSTNNRSNLINATQKLASDIRLAQSYSLGAKKDKNNDIPLGGWGVYIVKDATSYILFADADGGFLYEPGEEEGLAIDLPNGITVSSITSDPLSIVFFPPDPNTYFNGKDEQSSPTAVNNIQIELTDGETIKTIEVNFLGLVDVIN